MARHKKQQIEQSTSFLDALRFVATASMETGSPDKTHTVLGNNWALASNGTIAAGHKIAENISACPHTIQFIDALTKCNGSHSITLLDSGRLSVLSNKFRALVPCIEREILGTPTPDPPCGVIDDRFKDALNMVGVLTSENAQQVIQASVLIYSGSVFATDSVMMFEAWHGIDMPSGLTLPRAAITALVKKAKKLTHFGFSNTSITFYFEDESWIKSQLYQDRWPNVQKLFETPCNPWPIPSDFFTGLDSITSFSEDGMIRFRENMLLSHDTPDIGAQYTCAGVPAGPKFSAKWLKLIQPYVKTIDFLVPNKAMFFGDNMRGVLAGTTG